jgi:hypothetical protein
MSENQTVLAYQEQLRSTGSPDQLNSVRRLTLTEGPGEGMRLIEVCTEAGLRAVFLESHALDLYDLHFKGFNLAFLSKNGLLGGRVQSVAGDFVRTWPGGFLVTCGLRNTGPDCTDGNEYHPFHGRIGGMATDNLSIDFDRAGKRLLIKGQMRESALFGYHLVLERSIEILLDESAIIWKDAVCNLTPGPEPFFLLYHFNFGYPFLSPKLALHFPPGTVLPRTEAARQGLAEFDRIIPPVDGYEENVFFHLPLPANPPQTAIRLVNPVLGIAAILTYSTAELPVLVEWKSMRSTDYALGIEPGTSQIRGRTAEIADGYAETIPSFGRREFNLRLNLASTI